MNTSLQSFTPENVQFAWDASSLKAYTKCPYYYQKTILEGWRPLSQSVHLTFGSHYAAALEKYFKLRADGSSPEDATIQVVHNLLYSTWEYEPGPNGEPVSGSGHPWESLDDKKNRYTLIRSVVWYLAEFGENDPAQVVHLSDGTPAVELSFALPFTDDIIYCGHIDKLATLGGDVYVVDQKTSGSYPSSHYFTQFSPDFQMAGYSLAGSILFQAPIAGVMIDAAQIAIGFTRFVRGFVPYNQTFLAEWRENTLNIISRAQQDTREQKFFRNYNSCGQYGSCAFRKVCSASPDLQKNYLESDFVRSARWDPLARR